MQACNYIPIMDNIGAGFNAHTSYTIYHVCIICLWSLVGCTTLIHEPYTATMFPNAMRRKRHFFWICQLSQLLGQDLLSLALWVSHPVKLQSELQEFVWILNLQLKKHETSRKKRPFGPVKTCFEDENFLNFTEARLAGETSFGIRRSSLSISSFRLAGWPNCLTCFASVKMATFMQSEVTSPKNHWHPTHPDQTNDPVQYSDPS